MGFLDKAKFWKHEDFSLDIDKPAEQPQYDLNSQYGGQHADPYQAQDPLRTTDPLAGQQQTGQQDAFGHEVFNQQQSYPQYPQSSTPFPGSAAARQQIQQEQYPEQGRDAAIHPRDVELILAKLDGIKSELDALHQRVRKLEQIADRQAEQKNKYW